jgi:hypothetical protein
MVEYPLESAVRILGATALDKETKFTPSLVGKSLYYASYLYLCACHVIKVARNETLRPVQGTSGPACSLEIFLLCWWLTLNEQFLVVNTFQVGRLNNCLCILPIIH